MAADVLIVGGGLSGIAAARALMEGGAEVSVLEAATAIGGRATRDPRAIGPLGPCFLHSADRNPLTPVARGNGFELISADGPELCFGAGEPARAGAHLLDRVRELELIIEASAARGEDRPIDELLVRRDHWDELACAMIGPLSMGDELDRVSTLDYAALVPERGDAMVRPGLDGLVLELARGLPIRFEETPIDRIEWSRDCVRVHSGREIWQAARLVSTVSTGVLRSKAIEFDPPLPEDVTRTFDALPMSTFEKVLLVLDGELADIAPLTRARDLCDPHQIEWLLRPLDDSLAIAHVGGRRSRALFEQNDVEIVAEMARSLSRMLERSIEPRAWRVTRFHQNPLVLGSWSIAKPGRALVRSRLVRAGAIIFAGEAFDVEWGTTLAGAWSSGLRAAAVVLEELATRSR